MARRRGRGLRAGERALWAKVTEGVERTAPEPPDPVADSEQTSQVPAPDPNAAPARAKAALIPAGFEVGRNAHRPHVSAPHQTARAPLPEFDRRTRSAIAKGRQAIDARIDLHGMTLAQAHAALIGFLHHAHARDDRLVLVITGKGRGGDGALRRQVPHWIAAAPVAGIVIASGAAAPGHGGDGAIYVRLRRRPKPD